MVKAEILYEDDEKINILLKETDRAFVNSIRRTLISDTPKMAIDTVKFVKKTEVEDGEVWETDGPLPDEVIAQRLAMIPIPTNHGSFHFQDECPDCSEMVEEERGCVQCTMLYYCQVKGSKEGVWVTAGDLNFLGDPEGFIPEKYRPIPITKLFQGQMIEFSATAVMGRGRDHVKWSPVSGVAFNPRQIGVIKTKSRAKILWDLGLGIKASDFDKNGKLEDFDKVEQLKKDLNHVGSGTEESREFNDAVILEDVPDEFVLSFETDGSMSPKVAFEMAVSELSGRFSGIEDDLKAVL
ncbi:MAG: DNA-directed RNA polymerase subunit D [Euryarchaeota archaeon]|jgi:DNA-directed RNA polymerase subunit D|nr:DNA-directed RNA polymerase subunit D [Euryarchaeota archaeon]MAK88843.1 DNA-directed RNA polymerase subunit D [Euryarchaeota archaeon]|tara:strand:+ start:2531 stop:3418 length:888 start_codon:yes stop_codon:yes gene_type:complete